MQDPDITIEIKCDGYIDTDSFGNYLYDLILELEDIVDVEVVVK